MELTNKEQIKVLKRARVKVFWREIDFWLCPIISGTLEEMLPIDNFGKTKVVANSQIAEYIPLFTYENAVKYANAKEDALGYWWDYYDDKDNRLKFIDWMIGELNDESATNALCFNLS
jgi:hypothetical protein